MQRSSHMPYREGKVTCTSCNRQVSRITQSSRVKRLLCTGCYLGEGLFWSVVVVDDEPVVVDDPVLLWFLLCFLWCFFLPVVWVVSLLIPELVFEVAVLPEGDWLPIFELFDWSVDVPDCELRSVDCVEVLLD